MRSTGLDDQPCFSVAPHCLCTPLHAGPCGSVWKPSGLARRRSGVAPFACALISSRGAGLLWTRRPSRGALGAARSPAPPRGAASPRPRPRPRPLLPAAAGCCCSNLSARSSEPTYQKSRRSFPVNRFTGVSHMLRNPPPPSLPAPAARGLEAGPGLSGGEGRAGRRGAACAERRVSARQRPAHKPLVAVAGGGQREGERASERKQFSVCQICPSSSERQRAARAGERETTERDATHQSRPAPRPPEPGTRQGRAGRSCAWIAGTCSKSGAGGQMRGRSAPACPCLPCGRFPHLLE